MRLIEFYRKDEKTELKELRYALTVGKNGAILSSTTNRARGVAFSDEVLDAVVNFYNKPKQRQKDVIHLA